MDVIRRKGKCLRCGKDFEPLSVKQVFCSENCRELYWHNRRKSAKWIKDNHLSAGTVGAIAELMVSVALMRKGFEVFRALSPSCSCDLLATKEGKAYKVEVRTGYYLAAKVSYSHGNIRSPNVAAVTHIDGVVHFFPDVESFISNSV